MHRVHEHHVKSHRTALLMIALSLLLAGSTHARADGEVTRAFEIILDTGDRALGAYTLELGYNPQRSSVKAVAGGSSTFFSGTPFCNPATFSSGLTLVSAFQALNLKQPDGKVSITKVTLLTQEKTKSNPLRVIVKIAAGTDGQPLFRKLQVKEIPPGS